MPKLIVWQDGCVREEQVPIAPATAAEANGQTVGIYVFTFNHLLCGKEHKKEAEMMSEVRGLQLIRLYKREYRLCRRIT